MGQATINATRRAELVREDAKIFINTFEEFIVAVIRAEGPSGSIDIQEAYIKERGAARNALFALLTSKS